MLCTWLHIILPLLDPPAICQKIPLIQVVKINYFGSLSRELLWDSDQDEGKNAVTAYRNSDKEAAFPN